jgi:heme-degrading monooxygenase HmoA
MADATGQYAVIRRYRVTAGSEEEIARKAQEEFVPMVRGVDGFVAYYGVVGQPGEIATISIFRDRAGEEESTRRAAEWVKKSLAEHIQGSPEVFAGRITWQG